MHTFRTRHLRSNHHVANCISDDSSIPNNQPCLASKITSISRLYNDMQFEHLQFDQSFPNESGSSILGCHGLRLGLARGVLRRWALDVTIGLLVSRGCTVFNVILFVQSTFIWEGLKADCRCTKFMLSSGNWTRIQFNPHCKN